MGLHLGKRVPMAISLCSFSSNHSVFSWATCDFIMYPSGNRVVISMVKWETCLQHLLNRRVSQHDPEWLLWTLNNCIILTLPRKWLDCDESCDAEFQPWQIWAWAIRQMVKGLWNRIRQWSSALESIKRWRLKCCESLNWTGWHYFPIKMWRMMQHNTSPYS